jgi:hypothetical protein
VELWTRLECPENEESKRSLENVVFVLLPFSHIYLPSYAYLAMVTEVWHGVNENG